ncbi:pilus assembly protein CpaC [Enterobacter asburiae]|uniref:type II and III secretion system protein family protein n=1 Tax=Enterobacter asburiae TaxID=61645 RepID=UPI00141BC2E5|nr:pilus assembly protein N-terminal domain-containing protein [Enterobacter asburiae]NIH92213.1 pilus assembly protein CpaC [Enterobacter asburiae]
MSKFLYSTAASLFLCFLTSGVSAADTYLMPGDSQVIKVKENIDTVFISSPNIADYELIGDNSIVAYAKEEGRTDLVAFDKSGEQVLKTTLVVDSLLSSVHQQISLEFPDSNVTIQKMGKTYIISGTAPTEDASNRIYQIVGEGIGAKRHITQKKVKDIANDTDGNSSDNDIPWLDDVMWEGVINKLELPITNQVNVKLSVVEVSREFIDNVGLDWGTISSSGGSITPGTFSFIRFNADTLSSMVHAISNESVARVLAEPNLSVLSGETAEFLVGGEVPVVTSSQNGSSVSYKEFGIKLNIGAKVSNSKKIRLLLGEEVSNIANSYSDRAGDSFPALQTRRARTTVELADGESFLLGGLISNREREALSKIPLIGDVPILGALFRNASTQRNRSELVVVATVNLVKPISPRDVVLPEFKRSSTIARLFNLDGIFQRRDKAHALEFIEQGGFIK